MAVFEYHGIFVASGKRTKGIRDADNVKVLRSVLKRDGVLLTQALEGKASGDESKFTSTLFRNAKPDDVAMMTRQLATLVMAGIPLVEAVGSMIEQVDKPDLRHALTQIRDNLNEGTAFAKALEAHPKLFPPLYVNMAAAAEASGTLEQVLDRLADFLESQSKLKGKVGSAMAYPALMMIISTVLVGVMMTTVVPKMTEIYANLDKALPWYTQALITVSKIVGSAYMLGAILATVLFNLIRRTLVVRRSAPKISKPGEVHGAEWLIASAFLVVIALGLAFYVESALKYVGGIGIGLVLGFLLSFFVRFLEKPEGQLWKDSLLLKLPIFGDLFRMIAVSRFARTLSTLLKSGVPLLNAMNIVKAVLGNARLQKIIEEAASEIREGESIATPLKRSKEFPPMVTHMVAVGEKSGQLETMLENAAKAYDSQIENRVAAMTSLLEPLMMVLMGGVIGFIAFAILMPLVNMNALGDMPAP